MQKTTPKTAKQRTLELLRFPAKPCPTCQPHDGEPPSRVWYCSECGFQSPLSGPDIVSWPLEALNELRLVVAVESAKLGEEVLFVHDDWQRPPHETRRAFTVRDLDCIASAVLTFDGKIVDVRMLLPQEAPHETKH